MLAPGVDKLASPSIKPLVLVDPESPKSPVLDSPEVDLKTQSPAPALHDADLEAKQLMEDILALDLPDPDAPTRQEHEHAFKAIGEAIVYPCTRGSNDLICVYWFSYRNRCKPFPVLHFRVTP